jgi:hypothetical protein
MAIVVHAPHRPIDIVDAARRRFGCAAAIIAADSADEALSDARSGDAIAIIELSPLSDWWAGLASENDLAIVDLLRDAQGRVVALAVGRLCPADCRSQVEILDDDALRARLAGDDAVEALAMAGSLRLCVSSAALQSERPR